MIFKIMANYKTLKKSYNVLHYVNIALVNNLCVCLEERMA